MFPHVVQASGLQFGGKGVGEDQSFASRLAKELSDRIDARGNGYPIEIDYLGTDRITGIEFSVSSAVNNGSLQAESAKTGSGNEISLFRLR